MRTIFHAEGGGGPQPVTAPRVHRRVRLGLLIVLLIAFACSALAAAWDALSDIDARGQMDPTR